MEPQGPAGVRQEQMAHRDHKVQRVLTEPKVQKDHKAERERMEPKAQKATRPAGADGAQGPQGPAGADGAQGPEGPQGPAGADGAQGPEGPQGPAGADGAQGPQGPAGADGAQGPQGPAGADGAQGPQGPAGADGAQGPQGPAGADGAQGPQGPAGADGAQGPQGPAGADGAQGPQGPAGEIDADVFFLTSDVSGTGSNNYTDGDSLSLSGGTYLIDGLFYIERGDNGGNNDDLDLKLLYRGDNITADLTAYAAQKKDFVSAASNILTDINVDKDKNSAVTLKGRVVLTSSSSESLVLQFKTNSGNNGEVTLTAGSFLSAIKIE